MYSFTLSDEKDRIHKYIDLYYNRDTLTYSKEITTMFNTFFSPRRKIRAGEALPEFVIPSLRDSTVVYTNNSFRKGVYLLDFWATWCKPCMKEIPQYHKAYKAYHNSKDFEILSISFDKAPKVVENFRRTKWPMPWKHAILVKGKNDPLAKKMSALYLPQMILVDGRTNTVIAEMIRLKEGNLEKILYDYYNK
jgi:thiol-disulfide isomerase/thioredoxin